MSSFDEFLGTKYTLANSENFDTYLDVLGVNMIQRSLAKKITPTIHYTKEGEEYIYHSSNLFKSYDMKFKPGVEFDFETVDSRKVKVTITIEGSTVHEVQVDEKGRKHTFNRSFTKEQIVLTMEILSPEGAVLCTATRWFKAD